LQIVAVTDHAADLQHQIVGAGPSAIEYNSPKPAEILAEDKIVGAYDIGLRPEDVVTGPVEKIFE
jgi:zinc protease